MSEETRVSAVNLESRLEFETLISQLSSRFINLPPGEVDREIEDALGRVCELLDIDRAVLWQWSDANRDVAVPTHAWCAEEWMRPSGPMREDQYPWAAQQIRAGRMFAISSLEDYPAEAAVDRETCRLFGIKAGGCLPLSVGGNPPIGALGITTVRKERNWPDEVLKRLQLVAEVFTNALARKRHELILEASKARLAASADLAGLAFYELDLENRVAFVDDRLRDLWGVPPDRQQGFEAVEFWLEHIHPDDFERTQEQRRQLLEGDVDQFTFEYRFLHPTRGERWVHHVARVTLRDVRGRALRTFGVLRDITNRKRADDSLRDLSQRLIRAHEDERARLARELHDDLTQRLAVLAIDVGRAERGAQDEAQARTMRSVREGLVRLSEDVHSLAYQLHPSVLDELGLAEALRTECERLGRQGLLDVSASLGPLPEALGRDAALCLFRVAQEALNNVVHHAGARKATVDLRALDGGLLLAVRDDGVGFDPAGPRAGRSIGLAGMRERMKLVKGTLDVESAPGRGTSVIAWVPVERGAR
jgi:PAS domain S-box-containing protein